MIPKVFHWIWIGPKPLPERYREWINGWKKLHPDWVPMYWDNSNLFRLDNQSLFDQCDCLAAKSNIFRLEAVLRFGGLYLDTDVEPVKSADSVVQRDLLLATSWPRWIETAVIGAEAGHAFIQHMVDTLPMVFEECRSPARVLACSTDNQLANKCRATFKPTPDLFDDRRVFFPHNVSHPEHRIYPETVGIHHFDSTWYWQSPGEIRPMYKT